MTDRERPEGFDDPDEGRLGPPEEQLGPGEIDLTGIIHQEEDLRDVIRDAISEAKGADGEVPEWGARAIARYLADGQDPTLSRLSALHHFAVTGRADKQMISYEMHQLWENPSAHPRAKEYINWLGTYMIRAHDDPAKTIGAERPRAIAEAIEHHGPAFAALLRLPDVNYENAVDQFANVYVGAYDSLDRLVADTITTLGPVTEPEAAADQPNAPDPIHALELTLEAFDIVPYLGRYYVFSK